MAPRPTSMTHTMVTGQSTCQAASRPTTVKLTETLGSPRSAPLGGEDWQGDEPGGDILHTNWTTGPPSSWFHSLYFSFRHPGSGSKTLFMRGYPSKSCGILLSNSRCFLHIVLKTVTQVKSNERSITLWRYEI